MTIILKKNANKKDIEAAEKKLSVKKRKSKKGNLSEFFGSLKRGYDGLEYQKKVRSEWRESYSN
jgi:hypothetical protein